MDPLFGGGRVLWKAGLKSCEAGLLPQRPELSTELNATSLQGTSRGCEQGVFMHFLRSD